MLPMSWTIPLAAAWLALVLTLTGCATGKSQMQPQENFASTSTFSRTYGAPPAETCEAARRALLSQGYVLDTATKDIVHGRKNFQPVAETHIEMEIRVVCTPETRSGKSTLGFVTAQQDRFALKKNANSASLGVGVLGSVSLPFSASEDSMVRIGSETISSSDFYERLFALIGRFLLDEEEEDTQDDGGGKPPASAVPTAPVKTP